MANKLSKRKGQVYVFENKAGLVKIGTSINPDKRKNQIESASASAIMRMHKSDFCWNPYHIEALAHNHFSERKEHREWFAVPFDEAVSVVDRLFQSSAITEHEPPKIDTEGFIREVMEKFFPELKGRRKDVTHKEMLEALSAFYGEPLDLNFFAGDIELLADLDATSEIASMREAYPSLCRGVHEESEWGAYIENMFYTLAESALCPFTF